MLRSGLQGACVLALALSACGENAGKGSAEPSSGGGAAGRTDPGASSGAPAQGGSAIALGGAADGIAGASSDAAGTVNAGSAGHSSTSPGAGGRASSATGGSGGRANANSGGGGSAGATTSAGAKPFKGVANSPCAARTALNVSWYYNWEQSEKEPCTDGKGGEFVPMIWGHTGAEQSASGIQSAIATMVSKGFRYVLGFNEPDNSSQSNISTTTAISLLPGFDVTALQVGTPATQANTSGQAWFKDYMAKLAADPTLRNDFIAIHWYGWNAGSCDASASQLESYIKYAEGFAGNRPIWITEWSCLHDSAPTKEGVLAFYKGALAVFAKHPRLERYAWYPWTTNCELNEDSGALTALGEAYAAAPATK